MTTVYDVLRKPLITEKSSFQSSKLNQYAFEVNSSATKAQIKEAVELIYDVTVRRVNVLNIPARRTRRARGRGGALGVLWGPLISSATSGISRRGWRRSSMTPTDRRDSPCSITSTGRGATSWRPSS